MNLSNKISNRCKACARLYDSTCNGRQSPCGRFEKYVKPEKRKANLVHSLWMEPMRGDMFKQEITLFCFATSVAYAKHFNRRIYLYCDDTAGEMLSVLPYDGTYPLSPIDGTKTGMWAQCKFDALSKMELGDVHIDGDVFLKSAQIFDRIDNSQYDLIVQSRECPVGHDMDRYELMAYQSYQQARWFLGTLNLPEMHGCRVNEDYSWNCGLIGIRDQGLKDDYIRMYRDYLSLIHTEGMPKGTIPDLVVEQQFLYQMTDGKYRVHNLLGCNPTEVQSNAVRMGYMHVLSVNKANELPLIKRELRCINPALYEKVVKYAEGIGCNTVPTAR